MKKSQLRQIIREEISEIMKKPTSPEEKFLDDFNYQPFDDWYRNYENYISGELESGSEEYEDFIDETKSIINFLKRILETKTPSSFPKIKDEYGKTDWRDTGEMGG